MNVSLDEDMKSSRRRIYALLGLVILILIAWAVFFHFVPPEELVRKIGVQNTYLIAFLLAVIGGFSSITATSLYATLIALSQGGVNPTTLGMVGGLGLFLSDSLFYFVLDYSRKMITKVADKWETTFNKIRSLVRRAPDWLVYVGVFLYSAFAPLPNDILLAVLTVSRYSYRQFAPCLFAGDIVMALLLTHVVNNLS